ncbi:MAG: TonB-dependent receptor, partial [Spirochaetales bacterium]|nr:TonB-dependent receptor [Spirochaetales bacterium]
EFSNSENTIGVSSRYLVDARVEYEINKYKLFFEIDNMFDKDYIQPFLIPGKPRFYYMGVRYSF